MKIFKTVKVKLIIPPFILFLLIGILALAFGKSFFFKAINNRMLSTLNIESVRLLHEIDNNIENIDGIALLFSSMESVSNNFSVCEISQDTVTTEGLFSDELLGLSSDFDYNIDFYSSKGKLVYSNHKQKFISDDKKTLLKNVANTQKPFKGLENYFNEKCLLVAKPVISAKKLLVL